MIRKFYVGSLLIYEHEFKLTFILLIKMTPITMFCSHIDMQVSGSEELDVLTCPVLEFPL